MLIKLISGSFLSARIQGHLKLNRMQLITSRYFLVPVLQRFRDVKSMDLQDIKTADSVKLCGH